MTAVAASVPKQDYLDQDDPIRGQSYVCMSFLCPEQFLPDKQAFFISKFLTQVGQDVKTFLDNCETTLPAAKDVVVRIRDAQRYLWDETELQDRFGGYVNTNLQHLEETFHKQHNYATTMRGVKVRGVYASLDEARCGRQLLRRKDPKHNIWVGEVGMWLPLSDNPEDLVNSEYAEASLNELMREYNKNHDGAKDHFMKRKELALRENSDAMRQVDKGVDPWLQHQTASSSSSVPHAAEGLQVIAEQSEAEAASTAEVAESQPVGDDQV